MLNIESPHNPAMSLLGIYPRELKTHVQVRTYTQMFTAVLLRVAKK